MGVRIAFYEITDGKGLFDNFNRTFSDFKEWILTENENSINIHNERIISVNLESLLKQHGDDVNFKSISQNLLDELIFEYLLAYCDYGKGKINVKLIGPLISQNKYNNSFGIIENTKDEKLITLWNYLKVGRSLIENKAFTKMESGLIGFWNRTEIDYIKEKLKNLNQNDIGINCISNVLDEIEEKAELIIKLER